MFGSVILSESPPLAAEEVRLAEVFDGEPLRTALYKRGRASTRIVGLRLGEDKCLT